MNGVMKTILRSPLHGLVSEHVLLTTFAGRKSGKSYTLPLSYVRAGDTLYITTERPWYKNLAVEGGALVKLRLRGAVRYGVTEATTDPSEVENGLRIILSRYGGYGRFIGVPVERSGSPDEAALKIAAENGRALITVRLNGVPAERRDP
jgi:endonuclease YncB( thermonuclease family)